MEFQNDNYARNKAIEISGTNDVFFTNEGLEVTFTSETTNQKEIADRLKQVFSDVKVKGRKVKSILINRLSIEKNGLRVTKVAY
jgi:hypothetical protein